MPKMTSVPACSSDRINDCAPVKLTDAASSSLYGSASVSSALALRMSPAAHPVALPDAIRVGAQFPRGPVECRFGFVPALEGHALGFTGTAHDRVLGLEVALEPLLLGAVRHLQSDLPGSLPLDRSDVVTVLDLVTHRGLLAVEL